MTAERFDELVNELRSASLDTLVAKNSNYSSTEDKLHNFHAGAEIMGGTAAQAAWGYATKHLVALRDKIQRDDFTDRADFLEKCQDAINYICLIWCIGNEKCADCNSDEEIMPVDSADPLYSYRELVLRHFPMNAGNYSGGILGCPGSYYEGAPSNFCRDCASSNDEACNACWDLPYQGEALIYGKD